MICCATFFAGNSKAIAALLSLGSDDSLAQIQEMEKKKAELCTKKLFSNA
jgi:hypothetical protein